jgi:hypothetical protein
MCPGRDQQRVIEAFGRLGGDEAAVVQRATPSSATARTSLFLR